jgi:hypothetical protein
MRAECPRQGHIPVYSAAPIVKAQYGGVGCRGIPVHGEIEHDYEKPMTAWANPSTFVAACLSDSGLVESVVGVKHWPTPVPIRHSAPNKRCTCGIYAHSDSGRADDYAHGRSAWGAVYLWGRIIEHETGYRAEFAYPKDLTTSHRRDAQAIERAYEVPCRSQEKQVSIPSDGTVFIGPDVSTKFRWWTLLGQIVKGSVSADE